VRFVDEDGVTPTRYQNSEQPGYSGWPVDFRLDWMLERPGQPLPYASMFRREVWSLTGGYRTRARSSEDCDLWIRASSYGFVPRMVTRGDTLIYRNREGSMSRAEGWEEHRGWYPWTRDYSVLPAAAHRGAVSGEQIPFAALDPVVSVVIPVGPGHGRYVTDAVDSVDSQSYRLWECIVVNDSGEPLPPLPTWVRVVERACCSHPDDQHAPGGGCAGCEPEHYEHDYGLGRFDGVAAARNAGIAAARAALYLPLDADDMLQPAALEVMVRAHFEDPRRPIVYSDFWDEMERGTGAIYQCPDGDVLQRGLIGRGLGRAVTALTPVAYWRAVGGYSEHLPAWEDWAFAIACAGKGFCERRVAAPLFTYRKWTGIRREENMADFDRSRQAIIDWSQGIERTQGGELMACGSCGAGLGTYGAAISGPRALPAGQAAPPPSETAVVEYLGARAGDVIYRSRVRNQAPYRFSASQRQVRVRGEDIGIFNANRDFRVVSGEALAVAAQAMEVVAAAPVLVAAGAPPRSEPLAVAAPNAAGLPNFADMPALGDAPAAEAPGEAGIDTSGVLGGSMRDEIAAAVAPREDPEVEALVREHKRSQLNAIAIDIGIANAPGMSNMTEVARAVVGVRRMQAQQNS
jgi:glycosyltransferase involved in cell wall biosynthesis